MPPVIARGVEDIRRGPLLLQRESHRLVRAKRQESHRDDAHGCGAPTSVQARERRERCARTRRVLKPAACGRGDAQRAPAPKRLKRVARRLSEQRRDDAAHDALPRRKRHVWRVHRSGRFAPRSLPRDARALGHEHLPLQQVVCPVRDARLWSDPEQRRAEAPVQPSHTAATHNVAQRCGDAGDAPLRVHGGIANHACAHNLKRV